MRVAIPRFGENVAPCFEYSATIAIFTIQARKILKQVDFNLCSKETLDRFRLLLDQNIDVLICGGMQDVIEDLVTANGIEVISRETGSVEHLLSQFIESEACRQMELTGRKKMKVDLSVRENIFPKRR